MKKLTTLLILFLSASTACTNTVIQPEATAIPTPALPDLSEPIPTTAPDPETVVTAAYGGVSSNSQWIQWIYTKPINGVEMALVPMGCFQMGSESGDASASPVHRVCFEKPFWIDVYEVTNAQFEAWEGYAMKESHWTGDQQPREQLTWDEARIFCQLRGARLPTEAEWEYTARGPDSLIYSWGNDFVPENVVYNGNSEGQTWDVGSRQGDMSWVGVYDLIGNVSEWVSDWYDAGYYATLSDGAVNPQGPGSSPLGFKTLRGGSWSHYTPSSSTFRYGSQSSFTFDHKGFRCALSYSEPTAADD